MKSKKKSVAVRPFPTPCDCVARFPQWVNSITRSTVELVCSGCGKMGAHVNKSTYWRCACPRCGAPAFRVKTGKWYRILCTGCGLSHWFKLNRKNS